MDDKRGNVVNRGIGYLFAIAGVASLVLTVDQLRGQVPLPGVVTKSILAIVGLVLVVIGEKKLGKKL